MLILACTRRQGFGSPTLHLLRVQHIQTPSPLGYWEGWGGHKTRDAPARQGWECQQKRWWACSVLPLPPPPHYQAVTAVAGFTGPPSTCIIHISQLTNARIFADLPAD